MGKLQEISLKSFQMTCIGLVVFMIYQQFKLYMDNQNSSSVSYRKFHQSQQDVYPTFSLCLHSSQGGILMENNFDRLAMKGNKGIDSYHRMLVGHDDINEEFPDHDFDNIAMDVLEEFIDISVSYTKNDGRVNPWIRSINTTEESPFYKSYQDPYFRCITKSDKRPTLQILDDIVVLNASNFFQQMTEVNRKNKTIDLVVYVHHPGQLVRELGKKILILTQEDFHNAINGSDDFRDIHLGQVEVLRKRSDKRSNEPCDPSLKNDDKRWREKVMEAVNCVPVYWRGFYSEMDLNQLKLPECNLHAQYDYIHQNYLPPTIHLENGTNLYKERGPCDLMKVILSVTSTTRKLTESKTLTLGFRYDTEEYREIINREAFGKLLCTNCLNQSTPICKIIAFLFRHIRTRIIILVIFLL